MTDIFIDPGTNDLGFSNSTVRLTATREELARQKVQINLSTFKGEWFRNVLAGIPYLKNDNNPVQLLGATTKEVFDLHIKAGIVSRQDIVDILTYNSVLDKVERTLTISFTASTITGSTVSTTNLIISL